MDFPNKSVVKSTNNKFSTRKASVNELITPLAYRDKSILNVSKFNLNEASDKLSCKSSGDNYMGVNVFNPL